MLDTIKNFFLWIYNLIVDIIGFITSLVTGLINVLKSIPQILTFTTSAIGFLPSVLSVFATLTITISIIYLIVGRHTGGD